MSEEQTDRLEGGTPFEIRVLRELANLNRRFDGLERRIDGLEARFNAFEVRLANLEEKVDARLHDTRPMWESVLAGIQIMSTRLERMDAKFDVVGAQLLDLRTDVEMLKSRSPAA
jgi:tetrahydromethanopterin S-methyltransferase subunit G